MSNLYYDTPEGYEILCEAGLTDQPYTFCTVVVWRRLSDGSLWGAADEGCSCPVPFEWLTIPKLQPVRSYEDVESIICDLYKDHDPDLTFKSTVRKALLDA